MSIIREVIEFLAECDRRGDLPVHIGPRFCSRCRVEPRDLRNQRYCKDCRQEYRRETRKCFTGNVSLAA